MLVQITGIRNNGLAPTYKNGQRMAPGNCKDPFVSCRCGCGDAFEKGAVLAPYRPLVLFVSPRPGGGQHEHALFRSYLVTENASGRTNVRLHSEELVAGIVFARAVSKVHDAAIRQLGYGIVVPDLHSRQTAQPNWLFGEDVSSFLPHAIKQTNYRSYEFSFSI